MRGDTKMEKTKDISVLNSFKKIFSTRDFGKEAAERYIKRVRGRNSGASHVMYKEKLIDNLASELGVTKKEGEKVVEDVFEIITERIAKGDTVRIAKFGSFGTRRRATRTAINPNTGEKFQIKEINVPVFKADKELKEKVK